MTDAEKRIPGMNVKDQVVMCTEFLDGLCGDFVSARINDYTRSGHIVKVEFIIVKHNCMFRFLVEDDEGSTFQAMLDEVTF